MANISRENNFNIIRLGASVQVLLWHGFQHLKLYNEANPLILVLKFFPGVPIFFTISGFLIFASFNRNSNLKQYFKNRILRIYPALWVCFVFTFVILLISGMLNAGNMFSKQFFAWLITQLTFLQYYTPSFLRPFGVGTPNGSLWTIPIEISFYVFIPILFWLYKRFKINKSTVIIFFIIISIAYNFVCQRFFLKHPSNITKLLIYNLVPYLFYFLLGSLAYCNWDKIKGWYEDKGLYWIGIYATYCIIFSIWLHKYSPSYFANITGLISNIILAQAVLSLAFTKCTFNKKLLGNNDISYGVYLYHMPVINFFIYLNITNTVIQFCYAIISTIILACLSWKFVEKPCISLKSRAKIG